CADRGGCCWWWWWCGRQGGKGTRFLFAMGPVRRVLTGCWPWAPLHGIPRHDAVSLSGPRRVLGEDRSRLTAVMQRRLVEISKKLLLRCQSVTTSSLCYCCRLD
ncbi:unnamed protein product, partial [Ectocarpus fasciculatus]